jgi:hypothetical protein
VLALLNVLVLPPWLVKCNLCRTSEHTSEASWGGGPKEYQVSTLRLACMETGLRTGRLGFYSR